MAYRLQLPEGSRIHPIFHVSKLKRHIGDAPNMMPALPVVNEDAEIVACPEAVLSQRILLRKGRQILQVLIRWLNLQPEDATWFIPLPTGRAYSNLIHSRSISRFPASTLHQHSDCSGFSFWSLRTRILSTGGICHNTEEFNGFYPKTVIQPAPSSIR